jgi:hypothetical protein
MFAKVAILATVATMAQAFNGLGWLDSPKDFNAAMQARAAHMRKMQKLVMSRHNHTMHYFRSKAWAVRKNAELKRWTAAFKGAVTAHVRAMKAAAKARRHHSARKAARRAARKHLDAAKSKYAHWIRVMHYWHAKQLKAQKWIKHYSNKLAHAKRSAAHAKKMHRNAKAHAARAKKSHASAKARHASAVKSHIKSIHAHHRAIKAMNRAHAARRAAKAKHAASVRRHHAARAAMHRSKAAAIAANKKVHAHAMAGYKAGHV